jgi:hypothetical protein
MFPKRVMLQRKKKLRKNLITFYFLVSAALMAGFPVWTIGILRPFLASSGSI